MSRKEELMKLLNNDSTYEPLVEDMVHLEEQLDYLRTLPKIQVHPKNKMKQRVTPAAKLYKEMLQQYTNVVKILIKAIGADVQDEDSPLRKWLNEHIDQTKNDMDT